MAIPPAWVIHWHPSPMAIDPRGIFVATSQPSELRRHCPQLRPHEAWISLGEVVSMRHGPRYTMRDQRRDFPPRPERFRVGRLHETQLTCGGCSERWSTVIRFTDRRRVLYFNLVFGSHPSRSLRRQVEAVLNSVRVRQLP